MYNKEGCQDGQFAKGGRVMRPTLITGFSLDYVPGGCILFAASNSSFFFVFFYLFGRQKLINAMANGDGGKSYASTSNSIVVGYP